MRSLIIPSLVAVILAASPAVLPAGAAPAEARQAGPAGGARHRPAPHPRRGAARPALGPPLRGARPVTSPYGWRVHPILGRPEFHKGVDLGAPAGTPVVASAAGTVELAGWRGNYGRYVRLRHAGGLGTGYAHLARVRAGLRAGSRVGAGEVIGYVGSSGLATGPHLYYEVFVRGRRVDPGSVGPRAPGARPAVASGPARHGWIG